MELRKRLKIETNLGLSQDKSGDLRSAATQQEGRGSGTCSGSDILPSWWSWRRCVSTVAGLLLAGLLALTQAWCVNAIHENLLWFSQLMVGGITCIINTLNLKWPSFTTHRLSITLYRNHSFLHKAHSFLCIYFCRTITVYDLMTLIHVSPQWFVTRVVEHLLLVLFTQHSVQTPNFTRWPGHCHLLSVCWRMKRGKLSSVCSVRKVLCGWQHQ